MTVFNVKVGNHIIVLQEKSIRPYDDIPLMLLENLDTLKYSKTAFVLLYSQWHSRSHSIPAYIRSKFKGYRLILYQLEQLIPGICWSVSTEALASSLNQFDEVWDYDQGNAGYISSYGVKVSKILPMIYTESLNRVLPNNNPNMDVLFYGSLTSRRCEIIQRVESNPYNLRMHVVLGVFNQELDAAIYGSKIVLNIHAYDSNRQEQVRMFYPLINGRAVVSETSSVNNMGTCIKEATGYNAIIDEIGGLVKNNNWLDFGEYGREEFKKFSKDKLKEFE